MDWSAWPIKLVQSIENVYSNGLVYPVIDWKTLDYQLESPELLLLNRLFFLLPGLRASVDETNWMSCPVPIVHETLELQRYVSWMSVIWEFIFFLGLISTFVTYSHIFPLHGTTEPPDFLWALLKGWRILAAMYTWCCTFLFYISSLDL